MWFWNTGYVRVVMAFRAFVVVLGLLPMPNPVPGARGLGVVRGGASTVRHMLIGGLAATNVPIPSIVRSVARLVCLLQSGRRGGKLA
jgi:hypothetical protein